MKLSSFDTVTKANTGVEFEVLDPVTGEGSGFFITVLGTDGKKFKELNAARAREAVERIRNKQDELTPEQLTDKSASLLAACTVSWRGLQDEDGSEFEFSEARAKDVYLKAPVIGEQVDRAIADRNSFIKG